jgi:hypothetical protein
MSMKPCGQEVERNESKQKRQGTAADLAGARRGTRRRRESPEADRVRVSTKSERE